MRKKNIKPIIDALNQEYQQLVDSYISSGVDIDGITEAEKIKQLLDANKIVKFVGVYKGSPEQQQYFLNPSNTGLVASSGGKVATLFRIDKKGNNLGKVAKYFSRGVKLKNSTFGKVLASYGGAEQPQQQQQKKKEKPQREKQKSKTGDVVKRLKQAGRGDAQIRQILSKAFPKLPERDVDNMITNIKP